MHQQLYASEKKTQPKFTLEGQTNQTPHENKMMINASSDGNHDTPAPPAKLQGTLDPYSVSF